MLSEECVCVCVCVCVCTVVGRSTEGDGTYQKARVMSEMQPVTFACGSIQRCMVTMVMVTMVMLTACITAGIYACITWYYVQAIG